MKHEHDEHIKVRALDPPVLELLPSWIESPISQAYNVLNTLPCVVLLMNLRLPFDILLIQLGDVVCVSATTLSLGNCLERKFRSSLDAAERERGRKKWGSGALVSKFGTIQLLQAGVEPLSKKK